ncbi:MAG TPA: TIGR01777 family oxidoreductase [Rudaea sp.]|nr:TIGR01777 family oxidoreductase [Rudaea sp.]
MHYLITGGSGFIGSALCRSLAADGHRITVLTRDIARAKRRVPEGVLPIDRLDFARDVDAIVNLAGENLAGGRWSAARKREFLASRIGTTKRLLDWIGRQERAPAVLVSGSAVGWYGPRGDEELDENARIGSDFSAHLCRDWEAEARKAEALGVRVCLLRTGIVLDRDGGALKQMLLPFRCGLGGPMGHGRQWMSWIARSDLVALIRWLVDNAAASGAWNATAPTPVTNGEFSATLARALHRPCVLRTPAFALKLLFGEMADLLLTGQRIIPARASAAGFAFNHPQLAPALDAILA